MLFGFNQTTVSAFVPAETFLLLNYADIVLKKDLFDIWYVCSPLFIKASQGLFNCNDYIKKIIT